MSLFSLAIDGFLQRNPVILNPVFRAPAKSTRIPYPRPSQQFKPFPKPAVRPIPGASMTDEFQNQRFERGPTRLTMPGQSPVKTFAGVGGSGENPVYVAPEIGVKSYNAPISYGNLAPRVPVNYQPEPVGLSARY